MPIRGLTDREPALPRIGELRKGAPKGDRGEIGRDLHYFRFTSKDESISAAFESHYGKEPVELKVLLPYPTAVQNFQAWNEHWVAGGLMHRCDGKYCIVWRDEQGKLRDDVQKECPGNCKAVGRLYVIIPQLERLAIVTVLTTSIHDISSIHQSLIYLEAMTRNLQGMPFILKRAPKQISIPKGDKRVRMEKWLISIESDPWWVAHQLAYLQTKSLPEAIVPDDLAVKEEPTDTEEIGSEEEVRSGVIDAPSGDVRQAQEERKPGQIEPITQDQFREIGELTEMFIKLGIWADKGAAASFVKGVTGDKTVRSDLTEAEARMVLAEMKKLRVEKETEKAAVSAEEIPFGGQ